MFVITDPGVLKGMENFEKGAELLGMKELELGEYEQQTVAKLFSLLKYDKIAISVLGAITEAYVSAGVTLKQDPFIKDIITLALKYKQE